MSNFVFDHIFWLDDIISNWSILNQLINCVWFNDDHDDVFPRNVFNDCDFFFYCIISVCSLRLWQLSYNNFFVKDLIAYINFFNNFVLVEKNLYRMWKKSNENVFQTWKSFKKILFNVVNDAKIICNSNI